MNNQEADGMVGACGQGREAALPRAGTEVMREATEAEAKDSL